MSSRARKLAKRIELTKRQSSGTKHGCGQCRSTEFRSLAAQELVSKGLVWEPPPLICPTCSAIWRVAFGGDTAANATVSFTALVLS